MRNGQLEGNRTLVCFVILHYYTVLCATSQYGISNGEADSEPISSAIAETFASKGIHCMQGNNFKWIIRVIYNRGALTEYDKAPYWTTGPLGGAVAILLLPVL